MHFLVAGPPSATTTLMLAHGAGAAMDSSWMNDFCELLADRGIRTVRFEFGYMAARRSGSRGAQPRAENVLGEYREAVAGVDRGAGALLIGGKSFGGRVASMVADELFSATLVSGLLCLGYPFHPPGRPQQLRTKHLLDLKTPALICQGTRDEFGDRTEVGDFGLSDEIEVFWLEDGDHDLKPRKSISGFSTAQHLQAVADKVTEWTNRIAP